MESDQRIQKEGSKYVGTYFKSYIIFPSLEGHKQVIGYDVYRTMNSIFYFEVLS